MKLDSIRQGTLGRKENEMRASKAIFVFSLAALVTVLGCSGIKVATDHNQEYDFSALKSFAWMASGSEELLDPLVDTAILDRRVKRAVEAEMLIKGYTKSEDNPDFYISYHFGTEGQVDVSACGYHYPESPRCWGREVETYSYTKGTLVLDFVEPADLELVWRGYATGAIHDIDRMDETIGEAVRKVLRRFPPEA
jgi:hypothetical protein